MNKQLKLFHYDDSSFDLNLGPNFLYLIGQYYGVNVITRSSTSMIEAMAIINNEPFDIIILDMLDSHTGDFHGQKIIEFIAEKKIETNVWVFTGVHPKELEARIELSRYNFIKKTFIKTNTNDKIREAFISFLENNDFLQIIFTPYDEDDFYLRADILHIGRNDLNNLLRRVKEAIGLPLGNFIISRITSGYSGSVLFRVTYKENNINEKTFLLKASRNHKLIRREYDNIPAYEKFPPQLRLSYGKHLTFDQLKTEAVAAIYIEDATDTITLYEYLSSTMDKTSIGSVFNDLFLGNGLNKFYKNNKAVGQVKFTQMIIRFDEWRQSQLMRSITELEPLISSLPSGSFDRTVIEKFIFHQHYNKIDPKKLTGEQYLKSQLLCHGDLHSRNILIYGDPARPTLIDTGNLDYYYWPTDACRLLTQLFIEGIDRHSPDYFDYQKQYTNLDLFTFILRGEPVPEELKPVDLGFILAINEITKMAPVVYFPMYEQWEFCIGLAIELLKISYKSTTIPHSKRLQALVAAYRAILHADSLL